MKIAVRRRLATGVFATALAVLAGYVIAPGAQAALDTLSANPSVAFNNQTMTITLTPGNIASAYPPGSTVTFTRQGASTPDTFTGSTNASAPNNPTVTINFASVGPSSGGVGIDGPANPGVYNIDLKDPSSSQEAQCTGCFTVLKPGNPTISSVSPNALAQGDQANVTVTGSGFSRGSTVAVLLGNGSGNPDPSIFTSDEPLSSSSSIPPNAPIATGITTPTSIERRWSVSATTQTGVRDVQVTNTDGTIAICTGCFTVNGGPLTGVTPTGGSNDPNGVPVSLTFTGTGLNSGVPSLAFVGDAGSSTKSDLSITGTNPQYNGSSITANFDLRNAAPGNNVYQPTLTQSDSSQNTCTCRFSVAQPAPATIASLNPNSQSAGTTQTVQVTGTNFSQGVQITVSGTGVTTTGVAFVSPTQVNATFAVASTATPGARDVSVVTTDGVAGTGCTACYTLTTGTSPSPSGGSQSAANSTYVPLSTPTRVLDTRNTSQPRRSGDTTQSLAGVVPATATAAVLNVTVTGGTNPGFVTVFPAGTTRPNTSNVNFQANQQQANEVISRLANQSVTLYVGSNPSRPASVALIVDVVGYLTNDPTVTNGGRITPVTPKRMYDSGSTLRTGETQVDLSSAIGNATSVVLNVTVDHPTTPGFVVVYPTGSTKPNTSNVNFAAGQTQANEVITKVGTNGKVSLFLGGSKPPAARLIVDLVGTIASATSAGSEVYTPLDSPVRALDTRPAFATGTSSPGRKNGPVTFTLPSSVPSTAVAVVLNVTTTGASRAGFVTVYPAGTANPGTSNVNFRAGSDQANEVLTAISSGRQVTLDVGGANAPVTYLIADVTGYLTANGAAAASPSPSCSAGPPLVGPTCPSGSPSPSPSASP